MSNWQEQSKLYISKLNAQILGIKKILKLNTEGLIKESLKEKLMYLQKNEEKIKYKLEKDEYEVAIVGLEKAGKSSFANALIKSNILPSKDARCTYTSTSIKYGEENKAIIKFFTRNEFNCDFKKNLKEMGIAQYENMSFDSISLEEYREIFRNLDEKAQRYYGDTINRDIENILENQGILARYLNSEDYVIQEAIVGEEEFKRQIRGYIESPKQAVAVKEISIFSNELEDMKNVIVYDVPGFDSPTQIHMNQTIDKMKNADAIILIASASKPSFTAPQLDVFWKYSDEDGISLSKKLFVFGNKADAANSSLEENIRELKKEIFDRYKILDKKDKNRFHYGSARAKLEAIGKEEGTASSEMIKRLGITDGIDDVKQALIIYNQSERFEVLKTRINKMEHEIVGLFEELINKYSSDGNLKDFGNKSSKLTLELFNNTKEELRKALAKYRDEIRKTYNQSNLEERPITSKVKQQIIEHINVEKLGVTEEEKEEAINSLRGISKVFDGLRVSSKIREKKFDEIYKVYSNQVIGLAMKEHDKSNEDIRNIFIEQLHITPQNIYFEKLIESINEYILQNGGVYNDRGYYESLVERFSRDLIEILIQYSYSDISRWNKFEVDKDNFYSLGMFYEKKAVDLPAHKQPFNYMLLIHNFEEVELGIKEAEKFIEGLVGSVKLSVEIYELIREFTCLDVINSKNRLMGLFKSYDKESNAVGLIKETLQHSILKAKKENDVSIYEELTRKSYEAFFKERIVNDYDMIINEINEDICSLQKLLVEAVVHAINIEKPFLTKEIKSIDHIISSLDDAKLFGEFIIENIYYIEAEKMNEYTIEVEKQQRFLGITNEINNILEEMRKCD